MNYNHPKKVVYNQDVQPIYSDNPVLVWGQPKKIVYEQPIIVPHRTG